MNEHETGIPDRPDQAPPQTRLEFQGSAPSPPEPSLGIRLEMDEDDIGWILFDVPDKKVNTLNGPLMDKLRLLLAEAVLRQVKGLAFASDKPDMFIAGVDVEEIANIEEARSGMEKAAHGQAVFETVARFAKPTVAVITGPCLGGGYELALACDYRVAEKTPAVRIGLPEVKLGIVPGFGGTQRLPRRAGLRTALDVILAGKTLPARPAFRRGMVDFLVPSGEGRRVASEILNGTRPGRSFRPGGLDRFLAAFPPLRNFVIGRAQKTLTAKVRRDHYPASFLALDAVAGGYRMDEVEAYRNEARLLGESIVTETSKSLTWLFRTSSRAREPEGLDLSAARPVKRLAVVGAGVMGGGIAWLAGEKGIPIRVKDIAPEALEGAMKTAGPLWARNVRRRRLTPLEGSRRVEQLSFTLDYTGMKLVDLVVEAVVENLDVKRKVVTEVEEATRPETVIASNTSSLKIGDIALHARNPGRIVGLHFFNPVHRMPLVEVIAGPESAPHVVATAYRLALDLGKTPILVKDGPGFLVNRLLSFYLGEALHLFEKGLDPVRADSILTDFGMPMGPFELLDQIGLDVAEKVTHVIGEAFGERLPAQAVLGRLVEGAHLGKKGGRGFFVYERGKKRGVSPEASKAAGKPPSWTPPSEDVLDRMILPMVNEAARCLDEGVVNRPLDVDLGMVMGTGFPPFRGGILRYADSRGIQGIVDRLSRLADSVSGRLGPSEALRRRTSGFYVS
jgi:3-hydroxyacyl-CoA dehydrogenase/enoyl-CoA hydratase/3-hydroxybutyryl-CoA epimerase